MEVRVKLFATLTRCVPGARFGTPIAVEVPAGATLADLAAQLSLPDGEVKVVFVNGRVQPLSYALAAGDEVGIFPPIGGG